MKIAWQKTPEMFMKYIKVDKKENAVRTAGHQSCNYFRWFNVAKTYYICDI